MVMSISYTPGLLMLPQAEINLVPVDFPTPILAYSSPPRLIIGTTAEILSTLFTTVVRSYAPFTAGNGGLIRGLPLLPSSDSSSADYSPHIPAPTTRCTFMTLSKPLCIMILHGKPVLLDHCIACSKLSPYQACSDGVYIPEALPPN